MGFIWNDELRRISNQDGGLRVDVEDARRLTRDNKGKNNRKYKRLQRRVYRDIRRASKKGRTHVTRMISGYDEHVKEGIKSELLAKGYKAEITDVDTGGSNYRYDFAHRGLLEIDWSED